MSELHLVSPNDELSTRNGSAILTVAKELAGSARNLGIGSRIGGGRGQVRDLPHTVEALAVKKAPAFLSAIETPLKYLFGVSLLAPSVISCSDVSVVYAHNQPWLGRRLKTLYPDARRVLYVHNKILNAAPSRTIRRVLSFFDVIVCVSDYIRDDLTARAGGRLGVATVTVFNGVDSDKFAGDTAPVVADTVDIAFVGRVIPEKGALVFAHAVRAIADVRPLKVSMVGGKTFLPSNTHSEYEMQVWDALESSKAVVMRTGPIPPARIPAIMNASKVVAVPSVWAEPCALVFLEAMASSAAVVASSVGGLPEVGETSGVMFVEAGNVEALAGSISALLDDEEQRRERAMLSTAWAKNRPWQAVYSELRRAVVE